MEILIVAGPLTGTGGIETCIQTLAGESEACGDVVRVLALSPSSTDSSWHQGLNYTEVKNGPPSLMMQMLLGVPSVIRACNAHPPDVVVVIYSSTIPLVRAALLFSGLRRPVVSWLHFSMALKQRTSLLRLAHGHLAISSPIANELRRTPGVVPESVHLVFNGTRSFEGAMPIPRSDVGPLRLLYVGRLMFGRQKRTDLLFNALAQVEGDWRLDLIGAGDEEDDLPSLQSLAKELGIAGRLGWLGRQPDPWAVLDAVDLLVLCSEFEGFPMVLIEAMAHGIPCLSSDCSSGPSDIVDPGRNGWLFPVGDQVALANRLQSVVSDRAVLPASVVVRNSAAKFSSATVYKNIRAALTHSMEMTGHLPHPGTIHPHVK